MHSTPLIIASKLPNDLEPLHMNLTFQSQSTALIKNSQGKVSSLPLRTLIYFLMYFTVVICGGTFLYLQEIKIMSSISLHVSAL